MNPAITTVGEFMYSLERQEPNAEVRLAGVADRAL
jgi:hypothetical protein